MRAFFGVNRDYIETVYEEMFLLKYHSGFSIAETYNLPINLRHWFLKRVKKQIEQEVEAIKNSEK